MSNDKTSIHDFDLNLISEYYSTVERQGPGSLEALKKALSFIDNLSENSNIVDIGSGTGKQTMMLAQNTLGKIRAYDIFPIFIDKLNANAAKFNLCNRVEGIIGSMDNLPFEKEELDLIWSEGAIYNIGFERGINEWNKYLKKGGFISVSEVSWFTEKRPKEIEDFWLDAYPEIDTLANKVSQMQKAGYVPVATFILPEDCWIKEFYHPQIKAQEDFLNKYSNNEYAKAFIENQRQETKLYYKYKEFYGYVFYIGKKI